MSETVKIQIDLKSGTVLVEAPPEALDTVFDRIENFIPRLSEATEELISEAVDIKSFEEETRNQTDKQNTKDNQESKSEETKKTVKKQKRRSGGSKTETFKIVDLGLDESQRADFRSFYESKTPKNQNNQVLVIMYWLSKKANKTLLSKEEIFTGFKTVGARVPARISSVISNLMMDGKIIPDGGKYSLHHTAEDFVTHDLPERKKD